MFPPPFARRNCMEAKGREREREVGLQWRQGSYWLESEQATRLLRLLLSLSFSLSLSLSFPNALTAAAAADT
jgi:hypothetical protein